MSSDKDKEADRLSGHIQIDMEKLGTEFKKAVALEIKDFDSAHLTQLAASNTSNWSGGHSVHNFAEQAIREAAIERLRDRAMVGKL